MRDSKRQTYILSVVVIILLLGVGYAFLNSNLNINGTANITSSSWNIYWDNVQVKTGSVTDVTTPATIQSGNTLVVFNVNLSQPGDYYEFTVDAVNDGSIDAMIGDLTQGVYASNGTTPRTLPEYLEYTVTYDDGVAIAQNHLLAHNSTETYKVRVYFKEDINASQLPSTNDSIVFKFGTSYIQATGYAASPHPTNFADDGWSTIVAAVQSDNTSAYHVGDTKTINMGSLGIHTLRIANKSTPDDCSGDGFSQTACGFVLEYADIITEHIMNSTSFGTTNGYGNIGGWPASEMRTYVNSDIYNSLPEVLRNAIIDTTVVSGHGSEESTNLTSDDKLYLLAPFEIYGSCVYHDNYDTHNSDTLSGDETRQLDYYRGVPVTNTSYSGAIKQYNGSNCSWWMRSASPGNNSCFGNVNVGGGWYSHYPINTNGVSPAFRIGPIF